jgi:hypothetical protein
VFLFFKSVRNGGRNSMRVYRTCSVFFFRKKTAGENSMRVYRTCSAFFLSVKKTAGEILCEIWREYNYTYITYI